jgi:hypothetical protein
VVDDPDRLHDTIEHGGQERLGADHPPPSIVSSSLTTPFADSRPVAVGRAPDAVWRHLHGGGVRCCLASSACRDLNACRRSATVLGSAWGPWLIALPHPRGALPFADVRRSARCWTRSSATFAAVRVGRCSCGGRPASARRRCCST